MPEVPKDLGDRILIEPKSEFQAYALLLFIILLLGPAVWQDMSAGRGGILCDLLYLAAELILSLTISSRVS